MSMGMHERAAELLREGSGINLDSCGWDFHIPLSLELFETAQETVAGNGVRERPSSTIVPGVCKRVAAESCSRPLEPMCEAEV